LRVLTLNVVFFTAASVSALVFHKATPRQAETAAQKIVRGARDEVRRGVTYDAEYRDIRYPGGDVDKGRGACTDVVIRSLRTAGYDLQKLIHEDMKKSFRAYPKKYGLRGPDSNIDHRRVPNQQVFFSRFGKTLSLQTAGGAAASWRPGDIVTWKLTGGVLDHCGIVTDKIGSTGLPTVVHNLSTTAEEDCLTRWKITGHFRFPKD
jgi:uncharacterized protein YijF (DUF1287 family)